MSSTSDTDSGAGAGAATDALRHAARALRGDGERARQEFADALDAAQEGLQQAERALREQAGRHPIATVAAAVGAGLILGMLLGQRR